MAGTGGVPRTGLHVVLHGPEQEEARPLPKWTGHGTVAAPNPPPVTRSPLFGDSGPELTFWMPTGGGRLAPMEQHLQEAAFKVIADLARTYVPASKQNRIDEIAFQRDKIIFYVKLDGKKGREVFEAEIERNFNPAGIPPDDLFRPPPGGDAVADRGDAVAYLGLTRYREHYPYVFRQSPPVGQDWPPEGFALDLRPRMLYEAWHGHPPRLAPQVSRSIPEFLTMLMLQHKLNGTNLADLVDHNRHSFLQKPVGHLYESWLEQVAPPRIAPREQP